MEAVANPCSVIAETMLEQPCSRWNRFRAGGMPDGSGEAEKLLMGCASLRPSYGLMGFWLRAREQLRPTLASFCPSNRSAAARPFALRQAQRERAFGVPCMGTAKTFGASRKTLIAPYVGFALPILRL